MRIDYLELRDADELTSIETVARRAVMAVAAFAGTTRLIDNRVLAP
jgi:pantothenate synthetase